jgi:hypothetical protein
VKELNRPKLDIPGIIAIYNEKGKKETFSYIENVLKRKPGNVLYRLRNTPEYGYSKETDKFNYSYEQTFLSIDDLCNQSKIKKETHNEPVTITNNAYESLITDMLKEKLLEYSKYIKLDMSLHSCIINKAALKDAGYNVKIT